ncbi:MAG: NADH-quinone oxidoreductase subunit J, partial [Clostridiales bacterium]
LALLVLGGALAVILMKNIVHAVLCLIVSFIGVAGIFLTLQADFLAAVQILVYAGAVAILIIFALMMVNNGDGKMNNTNKNGPNLLWGSITALAFALALFISLIGTNWTLIGNQEINVTPVADIAKNLLTTHLVGFELAAILLLIAMIAAIIIAKEVKHNG